MRKIREQLQARKFQAYLLAFALMLLPPALLYLAARHGADAWVWLLIGLVVIGNLLAISIP